MKKYEKYKEVGLPWLKEIPEGWETKELGSIFAERREKVNDSDYRPLSVTKNGIFLQLENVAKTNNGDNRKKVLKNDFVINSRSDRKGSSGLSNYDGSVSLINTVLRIRKGNKKFWNYLLKSIPFQEEFYRNGKGIVADLWSTNYQAMKKINIPVPSLAEQHQIANFLDWKISEIDNWIELEKAKQERLDELKEKIIEYCLFTSMNKNCSMKVIESSYMKEIPELWDLCKISQLFKIQKKIANQSGFDVLSITQSGIKVKDISKNEGQMASDYSKYQIVEVGDFAMNHMDLITGYIDISKYRGVTSPDYRVFTVNSDDIVPEYYLYMFQLFYKKRVFYKYGRGAANQGRWRLPAKEFLNLYVPLPPRFEQKEIVKKIEEKVKQIDSLRTKIKIQISYLEELKQTLISDAVTGKIDVRNIKIPDYTHGKEEA